MHAPRPTPSVNSLPSKAMPSNQVQSPLTYPLSLLNSNHTFPTFTLPACPHWSAVPWLAFTKFIVLQWYISNHFSNRTCISLWTILHYPPIIAICYSSPRFTLVLTNYIFLVELCVPKDSCLYNFHKPMNCLDVTAQVSTFHLLLPGHNGNCFFKGSVLQLVAPNTIPLFHWYLHHHDSHFHWLPHLWLLANGSPPTCHWFLNQLCHFFHYIHLGPFSLFRWCYSSCISQCPR